jgi:CRP-like cAMP-binding protein
MKVGPEFLRTAPHRLQLFQRNTSIFHEGDRAEAVYVVQRGCVRLQFNSEDGQREVVAFYFPGDVIFALPETHRASAEAVCETALAKVSRAALWEVAVARPQTARALLALAQESLSVLAQHLGRLTHASALERVTWFLGWLSERTSASGSGLFPVPMTRRDIADYLGVAPETVSRLFRRLEDRGELRKAGSRCYVYRPRRAAGRPSDEPAVAA